MKKITLAFFLFSSLFLFSCGGETNRGESSTDSADESINNFMEAIKSKDFETAKKYTTASTDPIMDFLAQRINILEEMGKAEEVSELFGNVDFEKASVKCKEDNDNAICRICEEGTEKCKNISLKKEGGKWLVNIPKESNASKN